MFVDNKILPAALISVSIIIFYARLSERKPNSVAVKSDERSQN